MPSGWLQRLGALQRPHVATGGCPLYDALRAVHLIYVAERHCHPDEQALRLFGTFPASDSTRIGSDSVFIFDAILNLRLEIQHRFRTTCPFPEPSYLLEN